MPITEVKSDIVEVPSKQNLVVLPTLEHEAKLALYCWALWSVDMAVTTHGRYATSPTIRSGTVLTAGLLQILLDAEDYDKKVSKEEIIPVIEAALAIIETFDPEIVEAIKKPTHSLPRVLSGLGLDEFFWITATAGFNSIFSYRDLVLVLQTMYGLGDNLDYMMNWSDPRMNKARYTGATIPTATQRRIANYFNGHNCAEWMSVWYFINAAIAPPQGTAKISSLIAPKAMTWLIITFMNFCIGRGVDAPKIEDNEMMADALAVFYTRVYPVAERNGNQDQFDTLIMRIKRELVP